VKHATVVLKSRRHDDAIRIGPAVAAKALERHGVAIPWLEIGVEVDLAREDLGHRDGEIDAFAGRLDRLEQRRGRISYLPGRRHRLARFRDRQHFSA